MTTQKASKLLKFIDDLFMAYHEYGQHHDNCLSHETDDPDSCDCGYNDIYEADPRILSC